MYTNIKSVQILISLLKQFGIRHLVLSPGTRNTPFVHSVETDDFFKCYSMVDERSAGYFALGLAEALDVPVCVSCTAATATCNYLPAIKEAYERGIQLIALTADIDPYQMFHMEDQCINQVDMYKGYVNTAVDVPPVKSEYDYWYCNRCINEALLELNHHRKGPIQINYHMPYTLEELAEFNVSNLPITRKITRYNNFDNKNEIQETLMRKKRILVVCGSGYEEENNLKTQLKLFFEKYNCAIIYDYFSNQHDKEFINPKSMGDIFNNDVKNILVPDLIITLGNVFYSTIKYMLPTYDNNIEHWQISIDGKPNDGYHKLTKVFECKTHDFFENMTKNIKTKNNREYHKEWINLINKIKCEELGFTNFGIIKEFTKVIPKDSILHMSVLDSIRMVNYLELDSSIKCFGNIGADGIDGAISTLLGQSSEEENLAFLIIGDLSFMYDMNAILGVIPKNVRILVINNYAGAEFHKNFGLEKISSLNLHIAASHKTEIKQCAQMSEVEYLQAFDMKTLNESLSKFIQYSDKPIILEAFTDAATDAANLKEYWNINRSVMPVSKKQKIKNIIKSVLGEKNIKRLRKKINM